MDSGFLRPNAWQAFLFSLQAAIAAVLAYLAYRAFGLPGATWAPVSALVVMKPSLKTSWQAALLRFAANIVGATSGALCGGALGHSMSALALGVLLTGLVCHYARLDDSLRSAYAASAIVTLGTDTAVWFGSLDRVLAVVVGCAMALLVGLAFAPLTSRPRPEGEAIE
jgi:uncharacterized membrane protein YgaE (UPF0421/DUF939 family)